MLGRLFSFVAVSLLLLAGAAQAQGKPELQWFAQSAFKLTTPTGKVIMIDPWIMNNPKTPPELKDLDKLGKIDLILVTHGHGDHLGDSLEISKKNNAPMWAPAGLNQTLQTLGDMKLIGEYYKPDLLLIPIGGHFVMSPKDAAYATKLINPKMAFPMHYGTNPFLKGTPAEYKAAMGQSAIQIVDMNPGDKMTF